jgi:hypothetical protein
MHNASSADGIPANNSDANNRESPRPEWVRPKPLRQRSGSPFGVEEAEAMIRALKGFPLLDGARGRPKADVAALAQALSNLSAFAVAAGDRLTSVDINPFFVLPEGEGGFAADAVLEIAP